MDHRDYKGFARDPNDRSRFQPRPRRSSSSRARVVSSSLSARRDGFDSSSGPTSRSSSANARELRFITSWPETLRIAASDETRQTRSVERFSAARRSSSSSACDGEADGERADVELLPHAVEDDHAAGAPQGDEARQPVDERRDVLELARAQHVEAVEEVESRVRHSAGAAPRRGGSRRRRSR